VVRGADAGSLWKLSEIDDGFGSAWLGTRRCSSGGDGRQSTGTHMAASGLPEFRAGLGIGGLRGSEVLEPERCGGQHHGDEMRAWCEED
jgi:hypothetical protein